MKQAVKLVEGTNIKVLQLLPNAPTQSVIMSLNSKQTIVQSMREVSRHSTVTFVNMAGSLGVPSTQGELGFLIPQARVILKLDLAKLIENPQEISIDVKNYQLARETYKDIEIIQTLYYLRKDCYSMLMSRDFTKFVFCNVNERIHLNSEHSLVSSTLP